MEFKIRGNMNLFENLESILFEDIYGNKAIVYHRTRVKNLVNKIYTEGFKPGHGAAYGKGFYSTYTLKSQLSAEMENSYGPVIVKIMINSLNRFLILNYEEFVKSPVSKKLNTNKDDFVYDQMKYFNFDKYLPFEETLKEEMIKIKTDPNYFSSDSAMKIYSKYRYLNKFIDGMIFTGRNDGRILVCYNTDLIIPLSFSQDNGQTWIKSTDKNIDYLRKTFSEETNIIKFEKIKINLNDPLIKKNKIKVSKDSKFLINNNSIEWLSGTWEDGIWETGVWHHGTWKGGDWLGGHWLKGTWEKGIWKIGTWEDGDWLKGTWKDGHWYNGTWHDDTWKKGYWHDGTWKKGTWEDGIWKNGTWKGGTWLNGTWNEGEWLGGIWKGGFDKKHRFHPEGDSPDQWNKNHWVYEAKISSDSKFTTDLLDLIWEDGTWIKGHWKGAIYYSIFKKGIWKDGIWDDGDFRADVWEKGIWKNGHWNGKTWEDGIWEDGVFYKGDWLKGTWKKGTLYNGTWHNGIWENGSWYDGDWKGGTWLGGYDRYKNFHPAGDSPDKWNDNHWIHDAKISDDAIFGFTNKYAKNLLVWESGTWYDGTWKKGGDWLNGIWKNGTWEDGYFQNGIWEKGTWKNGRFAGELWKDGEVIEYISWEKGIWENGIWRGKYSYFHNGEWMNGTWESGIWSRGTWHNGTWLSGTWKAGTWKGGYDKFGDFHPKNDNPKKWILKDHWLKEAKFTGKYKVNNGLVVWEDGTWHSGTWKGKQWKKGTWEDGTFDGGVWKDGTWLGGIWKKGIWKGGYDKNGDFHPEKDSPKKWKNI
jgi:hypothetical protein